MPAGLKHRGMQCLEVDSSSALDSTVTTYDGVGGVHTCSLSRPVYIHLAMYLSTTYLAH